jgi:hypothetical protein
MWFFNQPSAAARTALAYITVGALAVIWSGVWYLYLRNYPPERVGAFYWCGGFMVTGITLVGIGLALGRIGRSAQRADLPPQQVPDASDADTAAVVTVPNATPAAPNGAVVVTGQPAPTAVRPLTPAR